MMRPRKDIESDCYMHGGEGALQQLQIETLLDCRDILGRIEENTEAIAVRAETLLPAERRSDSPIVEVRETTNANESNQLLRNEWLLIGSSVDPLGESHFLLGRRMK